MCHKYGEALDDIEHGEDVGKSNIGPWHKCKGTEYPRQAENGDERKCHLHGETPERNEHKQSIRITKETLTPG